MTEQSLTFFATTFGLMHFLIGWVRQIRRPLRRLFSALIESSMIVLAQKILLGLAGTRDVLAAPFVSVSFAAATTLRTSRRGHAHSRTECPPPSSDAINTNQGEQNGCRQRLEGYLSCQQRLALAVA